MLTNATAAVLPPEDTRVGKTATRLSWAAVFAGVIIAIAVGRQLIERRQERRAA